MPKIVILGAGVSGLSLGWFLKKHFKENLDLTIIEASSNAGGWIKTIEKENFLFELGPRSCRTAGNGIKTLELIDELQLTKSVIIADKSAKDRFLYINKKMEKLPNGIFSFLKSPLTKGAIKGLLRDFFYKKPLQNDPDESDESIDAFVTRKFNASIAENLFDPLTSGIYAGDTQKLSLKSCFPMLYEMEKEHSSLIKGMIFRSKIFRKKDNEILSPFVSQLKKQSIFSFKNGMQTLTNALTDKLKEHIRLSNPVTHLNILSDQTEIYLKDEKIVADYVFSTLSPSIFKELTSDTELQNTLSQFQATSIATISLGYKNGYKNINDAVQGFGYLIPSKEKETILGCVFDSTCFKEQNKLRDETRLTVMIGGAHFKNFNKYKELDFLQMALDAISKHLKFNDKPFVSHVAISKNAIPQYYIGHLERVSLLQSQLPQHFKILGSSYFGVSVNDCIANSQEAAKEVYSIAKKDQ